MSTYATRELTDSDIFPQFKQLCQRLMLMAKGAAGDGKLTEGGVPQESSAFVNWVVAAWRHEVLFNVAASVDIRFEFHYMQRFMSIKDAAHVIMDVFDRIPLNYKHFNARKDVENPSFLAKEEK